ncbi:hypothetical protein GOP47_0003615 [Adiantum capillus-veneris]|uniref:K-box domain-containing protein n=1 Tax=Adiantum capillus-veneris TaxID=13818 RepID=A0A9D4V6M8_ADICA|nr:hypothetical protein GOP47_0003615 [Adiantum capillus-veneris]
MFDCVLLSVLQVSCPSDSSLLQRRGTRCKGKLFQFANTSMQTVLERYVKANRDADSPDNNSSTDNVEADRLAQFTENLKSLQSTVIGNDLERLSLRDLIHLEQQIHESLGRIRAKKEELIVDQLEDFKQKVAEQRRITNANSSILDKLVDFCSSDVTGSRNSRGQVDSEHGHASESLQIDASPARVDTSEQSNSIPGCLPAAKRLGITEDLNQSPACDE